ncbi:MAG TPA: glucose-6-phosphate dehydrogenase, partial [Labilithrix sp.]|nr:glucose-6-phosphate dehydrogenase [Labilithrix sp.]
QDTIEQQWRIVDPILHLEEPPHPYEPGTWGPPETDRLVAGIPGGFRDPVDPGAAPRQAERREAK